MDSQSTWVRILKVQILWLLCPLTLHASFIESTMGTAVVNDATASYYNPAALTILSNVQMIGLGSIATARSQFTGTSVQSATGFTQSGDATATTRYYLPSLYLGVPTSGKVTFGFAVVSDFFNRSIEDNSILRYAQSGNNISDVDLVPAVGFKVNEFFSLGGAVAFSHANFLLQPISGFPSLNIPDAQSRNEADSNGFGGDIGLLLTPSKSTRVGFNYRSSVTYKFQGKSVFEGNPDVISNNYSFNFWTPARSVLSINHYVTPTLGFIGTVQRIQWSIFNNITTQGIAAKIGANPVILNATTPYYLRDTWHFTVGTHYRMTPKWVIRVAGNYNQTPDNGNFQLSTGDSMILGASMGYEIYKNIIIDGSFAHVFHQNQTINIMTGRNFINGENRASRDAFSLKLTFNK